VGGKGRGNLYFFLNLGLGFTFKKNFWVFFNNFANLCIMVWIHMNTHEYVFVFQNLNILCIFSDRFFDPFFSSFFPVRFRFFGSIGSMTGPVLVTLLGTNNTSSKSKELSDWS
jgi:hypothetical protein